MKRIKYIIASVASMCLMSDCITPYEFDVKGFQDLLVVEGVIIDGETSIRLSRTMPLNPGEDEWAGQRPVSGAEVWIEGENGDRFEALGTGGNDWSGSLWGGSGEYIATGVSLNDDVRYRLRISLGGEEFESDYRLPQSTPPIESVDFHLKDPEEGPLQIRFNVQGKPEQSRYYMWSYEENWETTAYYNATHYLGFPDADYSEEYSLSSYVDFLQDDIEDNEPRPLKYPAPWESISPYYYCWKSNRSRELLLTSTDLLTENTLRDHVLFEIALSNDRLSELYRTRIHLYSIAADAYYYFSNQKENTDQAGSIFAPIPSEMMGNIVCTTSPEETVIGFVDVSRRVTYESWIRKGDVPYRPERMACATAFGNDPVEMMEELSPMLSAGSLFLLYYDSMSKSMTFVPMDCRDCRMQGGSKYRPASWPNNHY
jgi:hypothetical protein